MHAASLPAPAALSNSLPAIVRRPLQRRFAFLRHEAAASPGGAGQRCKAATLPSIDGLHEACAPEGALYVDGVLFGGG